MRADLSLLVSDFVLEETRRNLLAKAPAAVPLFEQFCFLGFFDLTRNPTKAQVLRAATVVEAKDAPIVAAAVLGRAEYLITHDVKHLLAQASVIETTFGVKVQTPGGFLQLTGGSQ